MHERPPAQTLTALRTGTVRVAWVAALLALSAGAARPTEAQLPNASTRALGMGGNYGAVARGYPALAWNPALLGLRGGGPFTFALAPVTAVAGLDPISLSHLAPFGGDTIPRGERDRWMAEIDANGGQRGRAGGDVTVLAASIGPLAFQLSTVFRATANLSPGAAELVLFGNAGRTGQPCECALAGSSMDGHAVSTAAVGFGVPVHLGSGHRAALGVTVKYSVGHVLLHALDLGSTLTPAPLLDIRFPVVMTAEEADVSNTGSGIGVDLGFAFQRDDLTLGFGVRNAYQSFAWDEDKLRYRPGTAVFNRDTNEADFDEAPFVGAPAPLKRFVEDQRFKPLVAAGVALTPLRRLTISGDVRARLGESSLDPTPALHVGAGTELRLPLLSLRAGAAVLSGGYQVGGGVGLNLGPMHLGASVLQQVGDAGTGVITMFTLLSAGR